MIKTISIQTIICLCLLSIQSKAQDIPMSDKFKPGTSLSLENKVKFSDAVIEGVVINETRTDCFLLDSMSRNAFTSVLIKVSRIFEGEIKDSIIELVLDGGRIPTGEFKGVQGGDHCGFLGKGYQGIFFLRDNATAIQSGKKFQSFFYLYPNSLIYYSDNSMPTATPSAYINGKLSSDLENDVYRPIEAITHTNPKILGPNSFEIAAAKNQQK
jgi:hypothetical protein